MKIIFVLPHTRITASLTITFQFLFHFRGRRRLLLFIGALFAQEIPKELILVSMDYDVALRLENVESYKYYTVKLRGSISKFKVPGPSIPAPILFYIE